MTRGADLTAAQVAHAIDYNTRRFDRRFMQEIQRHLRLPSTRATGNTGVISEPFVRDIADWQEANMRPGSGSGVITPVTEANMGLLLPEAQLAVRAAERMFRHNGIDRGQEGYLYDGWTNDIRDNDLNHRLDSPVVYSRPGVYHHGNLHGTDPGEDVPDSTHYHRVYRQFNVRRGTYAGGWRGRLNTFTIAADTTVTGRFVYRCCADIVSEAYRAAGVMSHHRRTVEIRQEFSRKGWIWRRSLGFPARYLPGDFICTVVNDNHGHAGIVVEDGPTGGGAVPPMVIDLQGPSSSISEGNYDPTRRNDLRRHRWPSFRLNDYDHDSQFLCRLLHSKLHRHH